MGTWPIYKKKNQHLLQLILIKKIRLIKYLLTPFIFFLSFQSVLVSLLYQDINIYIFVAISKEAALDFNLTCIYTHR